MSNHEHEHRYRDTDMCKCQHLRREHTGKCDNCACGGFFEMVDDRTTMKAGKLQLELIDLPFVAEMALQLQAGLVGDRVPDGWRDLDPEVWVRKYRGALMRHLVAASAGNNAIDSQTGATHWAGVAVNAMICGVLERMASKGAGAPSWACAQPGCSELKHRTLGYCGGGVCEHLQTVTGAALDVLGEAIGLGRGYVHPSSRETDADYRKRIVLSS